MAIPKEKGVTYEDYASWGEDIRCEVIDGHVISYNFSPSKKHQDVLGNLFADFHSYLRGKKCDVTMAPFDVYLFATEHEVTPYTDNWLEPDLFVVCNPDQYEGNKLLGAPELVIEVLSPSNPQNDKIYKLNQYEKSGVQEYWIVDPNYQIVEVYLLEDSRLRLNRAYSGDEEVSVHLFKDLTINLEQIFEKN